MCGKWVFLCKEDENGGVFFGVLFLDIVSYFIFNSFVWFVFEFDLFFGF